ncbi:hypothetical protein H920_05386 [Fukomys damarensis]|uniref:Uncharacterized protein n=1 Tax=Fukomys damarensis TaxID=885580 RepID=A0A091DRZ6_FUKDA|nr:hypothetical protein H920_05386 [Fukomys damarensis]
MKQSDSTVFCSDLREQQVLCTFWCKWPDFPVFKVNENPKSRFNRSGRRMQVFPTLDPEEKKGRMESSTQENVGSTPVIPTKALLPVSVKLEARTGERTVQLPTLQQKFTNVQKASGPISFALAWFSSSLRVPIRQSRRTERASILQGAASAPKTGSEQLDLEAAGAGLEKVNTKGSKGERGGNRGQPEESIVRKNDLNIRGSKRKNGLQVI